MRIMNNSKTLFESFQENLKEADRLEEEKLEPKFSGRKSFYGKANVDNNNGVHRLVSYETPIMEVKDGNIKMLCRPEHLTQTTLRHVREFLQQMGLEPLSKQELIKLIGTVNEEFIPNQDGLHCPKCGSNEYYEVDDEEYEDGTQKYHLECSKCGYNSETGEFNHNDLNEQDTMVRVVTPQQEERDYSITDITELNQVADGDVQPPIDIAGLLVDVDSNLTESYGANWGQINFQSTRYNNDTKDSNALFELCIGDKTYLMSMLLEENGSVLKVNNTKGQTIFKRKSKDMVGLAESYIKQFLPGKENEEVPECLKHMNEPLHAKLDFIKSYIETIKSAPKESKDELKAYAEKEIYGFIAELSDAIKAEEPTDEDKLELPTFDKMVEEVFGKEWVKVENTPDKVELNLDGVEELKEAEEPNKEEVEAEVDDENSAEELDKEPSEEPKNGLGTGYATFIRKPNDIADLDNRTKYFTDGDSSYLICQKETLSKDDFDKIQEDFTSGNQYCKSFEPLDTNNYSFNVIEFSCPDVDYKLLVDPSDSGFCKWVAKVGGNV